MPLDFTSMDSAMSPGALEPALVKFNAELFQSSALVKFSVFSTKTLPVCMGLKLPRDDLENIQYMLSDTQVDETILRNLIEGRLTPLLKELYRFHDSWQEQQN